MTLRRIDPISLGAVSAVIYAIIGLIVGLFMSLFGLLGSAIGGDMGMGGAGLFGLVFGAGAIIFAPILYGVLGFIGGVICAVIYNVTFGLHKGLKLEFDTPVSPASPAQQPYGA